MGKPFIVLGDKTSHGGVVIEAAPTSDSGGIRIARVGDKVSCRKHSGTIVITTGDPTCIIEGKPAARHGDMTSCGATLIASQFVSTD
ncbi:MAG: PAAR domain-containing protein [Rubrivivax sp.]|nr:PAAR domain-containing protein [Rubrivivax sp.]